MARRRGPLTWRWCVCRDAGERGQRSGGGGDDRPTAEGVGLFWRWAGWARGGQAALLGVGMGVGTRGGWG